MIGMAQSKLVDETNDGVHDRIVDLLVVGSVKVNCPQYDGVVRGAPEKRRAPAGDENALVIPQCSERLLGSHRVVRDARRLVGAEPARCEEVARQEPPQRIETLRRKCLPGGDELQVQNHNGTVP